MKKYFLKKSLLLVCLGLQITLNADVVWNSSTTYTIPADGQIYYTDADITLTADLYVNGTLDVYNSMYTCKNIQNGDTPAGTINIKQPGAIYILGGTLDNNNANSLLNVKQGGALFNYYGTIDLTTGGADSLTIEAGGKFDNIRGTNPGSFTINTGANFLDYNEITLDRSMDIDCTWTITSSAVLKGNGNQVTFGSNGGIVIDANASLLLEDVILNDVSGNQIDCTDNSSTLSIDNVIWNQDANYSFTKGKLYIAGDLMIQGKDSVFSFETDQTSSIASNAGIDLEFTVFQYNSDSSNLLYMTDATSYIHLNRGTLKAAKDCTLQDGTLLVNGRGTLQGDAILNLENIGSIDVAGSVNRTGTILL